MQHQFTPAQVETFWSRVDRSGGPDACWPWTGGTVGDDGYGRIRFGKTSTPRAIQYRAHRLAWELIRGPIPDGMDVLHTCDNRACVRNDEAGVYVVNGVALPRLGHLFLGTRADNNADRDAKGRAGVGWGGRHGGHHWRGSRRGVGNPAAKLTANDVVAIRAAHRDGTATRAELAHQYGVGHATIWNVLHRRSYANVE